MTIIAGYINLKGLELTPGKNIKLFAIVVTQHRLWGTILMPYILKSDINRRYYTLSEQLFPFPDTTTLSTLAEEEREVIRVINEYSDRNLFTHFSKNNNVKEFLEKVTRERIDQFIRPYIERKIYKCISIARDEAIPVYLRKSKINTLHSEDQMLLEGEPGRPVFRFNRNAEQSSYSLSLETGGRRIDLKNNNIEVLCNTPCLIRENNNLIFVSEVDALKLKPFFIRDSIIIPKNTEEK